MIKIFISYAKKDARKLALDLATALNAIDGVSVWVDKSLRAGKSWELQIQQHIDECDTMIVLYSPDINRHKEGKPESYVLTEIHYAKRIVKKPIIPVMAVQTDPPLSLALEQYIDFTLDGLELDDLVVAVCNELHIDPTRKQAKAADTPAPTRHPQKPKSASPKPQPRATADAVRNIIGAPFDWCEVPAGEFIYGGDNRAYKSAPREVINLPTFYMAKYPITYKQFQAFIDDKNGFAAPRWRQGFADKIKKPGDQKWKINNHPRENVSWYDALAFCRWLSWRLGNAYRISDIGSWSIRLPTEFEWEKAARGVDGFVYPYGNVFDKRKSNTDEAGLFRTTPVAHFPEGASPFGVVDMSGNVWEWCLSNHAKPAHDLLDEDIRSDVARVLRGGSWYFDSRYACGAARFKLNNYFRNGSYGFRICCPTL